VILSGASFEVTSTKKFSLVAVAGTAALALASCSSTPKPAETPAPAAKPAASASATSTAAAPGTTPGGTPDKPLQIPDDIQDVAVKSLGTETTVLAYGELANNGKQQILAINAFKTTPPGVAPGILFNRLVVLQKNGDVWKEVLRGDEHLENEKGFLGGIPLAPVNGWRLQLDQTDATKGVMLYFSPIVAPKGGHITALEVRWNPKVGRFQSMDPSFTQFVGEVPQLETPESQNHL
jgi:hypothetical protein